MYTRDFFVKNNIRGEQMKKMLVVLSCMCLLVGCSFMNSPKKAVEELLKKYQSLDEVVLNDLELTSESSVFTGSNQRNEYMKAMKMQYSDLKYEITNEEVNGDEAVVTVKISVYDFYKVQKKASDYLNAHMDEFMTDGNFDNNKFMSYKIKQMQETSERVEYTINVDLKKNGDEWKAEAFDRTTLEKLHGTYNYEQN